jgi:hypothetical protein
MTPPVAPVVGVPPVAIPGAVTAPVVPPVVPPGLGPKPGALVGSELDPVVEPPLVELAPRPGSVAPPDPDTVLREATVLPHADIVSATRTTARGRRACRVIEPPG